MKNSSVNISTDRVTSSNLTQSSINLVHDQLYTFIITLIIQLLNLILCLISLRIFSIDQQASYRSRTMVLLRLLFANSLCLSAYCSFLVIWHVINGIFGFDELFQQRTCFVINGGQIFFILNNDLLTLMIAIDRFLMLTEQTISGVYDYKNARFIGTILSGAILSFSLNMLCLFDQFDTEPVLVCTLKSSLGSRFLKPAWFFKICLNWATVCTYIVLMVLNQLKIFNLDSPGTANQANLNTLKLAKRLSKVLAFSTIIYFILGPLSSSLLFVLATLNVINDLATSFVGAALSMTQLIEGSFYALSLLAMKAFRDDFRKLVVPNLKWFENNVGVVGNAGNPGNNVVIQETPQ